jgi:hypothetical protein
VISPAPEKGQPLVGRLIDPSEKIIIRKRLSHNEHKHRYLKWFAREDDLYRRFFPADQDFQIEIGGRRIPGLKPNFERRTVVIGEGLHAFSPGDQLLVSWSQESGDPTLVITCEDAPAAGAKEEMTFLRSLITRLISRPLSEFNEGEVKGLIALLDENKKLWERVVTLKEENEKLKEQIATLESVFDQFSRNSFFGCKKTFDEWVFENMNAFERGIRVLHRDYSVSLAGGKKHRIDLLCQDRKGVLVAAEVVFNPTLEDLEETLDLLAWLQKNIQAFGQELTQGQLKANVIRGMVIANRERPHLVEYCLQKGIKLCVVNSGCVIDVFE